MLSGTSKAGEVMLYTGSRVNSDGATGPVTAANSFKRTVLSAVRPGRYVGKASFLPTVVIREVSEALNPSSILRV